MKSILKNPLTIWIKWFVTKTYYERKFSHSKLKIGHLTHVRHCQFGNYNTLESGSALHNVKLGDFTYVAANSKLANVVLGKFCSVGNEVLAGLGKHPTRDFVSTHPIFYSPIGQCQLIFTKEPLFEEFSAITIGNDVWIGARSILLDGISIGDGAIIAAGSVVTKDVPPYVIVGGVPAKMIRNRFSQEETDYLKTLKWWDRDLNWIKENFKKFHHIRHLMDLVPKVQ